MLGERARHLGHLPFSLEQRADAARLRRCGFGDVEVGRGLTAFVAMVCRVPGYEFLNASPARDRQSRKPPCHAAICASDNSAGGTRQNSNRNSAQASLRLTARSSAGSSSRPISASRSAAFARSSASFGPCSKASARAHAIKGNSSSFGSNLEPWTAIIPRPTIA
jgi:hypothetical protein